MSKFLRLAVAAIAAVSGSLVFVSGVAHASVNLEIGFSFQPSPITVGDTALPVQIRLQNDSDDVDDGQSIIVCNAGNPAPCGSPSGAPPKDVIGIGLLASCVAAGTTSTTCGTADPGVFVPTSLTAAGGGSCAGTDFSITTEANGTWRFAPLAPAPANLELADDSTICEINFSVNVEKYPSADYSVAPGRQIAILGSTTGYSIDVLNGPEPADDAVSSTRTIVKAQPNISTTASGTVLLGSGTITDTALVASRAFPDATANVSFRLFGPNDATCAGPPVFQSNVAISGGSNTVVSEPFAPTAVGTYRWIATYEGDSNNLPAPGVCNAANESVVVTPGQPTLATTASPTVRLGAGDLTDTATVTGRVGPLASTVSFSLFGPDNATCANPPIFTNNGVALPTASDSVTSAGYTPTAPGTYRWIATYSGDANNLPAAGACNDAGESTVVDKAQPVLVTDAGADVAIGDALTDTATITGRVSALAATLDFRLFGPNNADCSGAAVFEQLAVPFTATDDAITSAAFTPTATGTYRWVVTYSGDANNAGAVGVCGDPLETVQVNLGAPTIVTEASASVPVGVGQLSDAATVNGRVDPQAGATVSFRLYGPGDTTCSAAPVFEDLNVAYPVGGGTVRSGTYTPLVAGTYRWVASYSGDANNLPATGVCGDPTETVAVTAAVVPELPATGSETGMLMRSGGLLFLAGVGMMGLGSRKRSAR